MKIQSMHYTENFHWRLEASCCHSGNYKLLSNTNTSSFFTGDGWHSHHPLLQNRTPSGTTGEKVYKEVSIIVKTEQLGVETSDHLVL